MKQSEIFLLNKDIAIETVGQGITRQILGYNDNIMLVKVMFETGSIGDAHSHPHVQSTYVESGKFEVTIDSETLALVQGDGFLVPENKMHGVVCLEKGVLLDCFSPVREDFIQ